MSDEARAPEEQLREAPPAGAEERQGFERVEFWCGISGVRRHQQLVACEAQRDLGSIVVFIGAHIALAGFLLGSQAKRRQKRVMAVDRP